MLEGTYNALAAWGYNRDHKEGKMQLVVGLLTDRRGEPISTQVYRGNTSDLKTFGAQIRHERVSFVLQPPAVDEALKSLH